MRRTTAAFLSLSVLLLPSLVTAKQSDLTLRLCLQAAMNTHEQRGQDAVRTYNTAWVNLLEDRRVKLSATWGTENDASRDETQRFITKAMRTSLKDAERIYRDSIRTADSEFDKANRACRDLYKQRLNEVPVGQTCYSSAECKPPLGYCTTETGECRSSCKPGSASCVQVCSGRCRVR